MSAIEATQIDYLRRCDLSRMSDAERIIHDAMVAVNALPSDERLSDATSLLQAARFRVADFVDQIPGQRTFPFTPMVGS